jgi:uncharacterized protein YdeI (BOF family)
MRRVQLALVTTLALAAGLVATASAADGDGTLSVQGAAGLVQVRATGATIGRITDQGTLRITDSDVTAGGSLQLFCPDGKQDVSAATANPDDKTVVCTGANIRFRIVGGSFRFTASGGGINVSIVGQGHVTLSGAYFPVGQGDGYTVGTYSVNDSDAVPMPVHRAFGLDASTTT